MLQPHHAGSGGARTRRNQTVRRAFVALISTGVGLGGLTTAPALAAAPGPASAAFTGGAGTVTSGGTLFAKQGSTLTLTVSAPSGTQCVDVAGAFTDHQTSSTGKSTWTFTTTAGAGDGAQSITAAASGGFNKNGVCTGQSTSAQTSYTLDNTGPVVTGTVTPAPNGAGWNNSDVSIVWAATDAGSGLGAGPTPATDSVTSNTVASGATKTATASDKLGNSGTGSVTVKLDKGTPTISGSRTPVANSSGWNNSDVTVSFSCDDTVSGVKSCPGSTTLTRSVAGQSTTGKAVDNADNEASATVGNINIDKVAPTLTGTATTKPNAAGWYNGDVTVAWTASDALSGLAGSLPANSTITGQGDNLSATASVSDKAGNTTNASSEVVKIDRTAPITSIAGDSNTWTNGDVTVNLAASDNLSGVASTSYTVDNGATQSGNSFSLSSEGDHTVTYWSTDKAGNVETTRTAHVKIDKTAPSISHSYTKPDGYQDGSWTNQDVTVTFTCTDTDTGSGVASCTDPVTTGSEGADQRVLGTATDNAGNSATDSASVNIDKAPPTIKGAVDRPANDAGWYNKDVTVSFTAGDALSGVTSKTPETVLGEGADQSVTGTASDAAGNSASDTVSGINIDKTAPVLTATYDNGWHNTDVAVTWACADALSEVATGPSDDTVTGEGDNLTSPATCTDKAGNVAAVTVSGIKIDRHAPSTTASVPEALPTGWYGGPVTVTLNATDALSKVAKTYYSVDGNTAQEYNGAFPFTTKGEHTVTYWSVDNAGNVEDKTNNVLTLKIDGIAPTTTVVNPISPDSGWFVTSGIPVAFTAVDQESGIAATYYTIDGGAVQTYGDPFTATLGDGTHTITYWSEDIAGNVEAHESTNVVQVSVDTTPPTITGHRTEANINGWNNTDVSVTFTCDDNGGSGIDNLIGCGPDTTVSSEGRDQQVQGDAQDVAGHKSSTVVDKINIDKTAPSLTGAPTGDGNGGDWYRGDVTIAWTGKDGLSGVDPDSQPTNSVITGEGRNLSASATIKDEAGNLGTGSVNGINIDRNGPVITGHLPAGSNAAGWYRGDVSVSFTCTDPTLADGSNGSGVAGCPTEAVASGDGANQSVTSDKATDKAGNATKGVTLDGIKIDGHAPQTSADNQCTSTNGYCTGDTATVALKATDVGPSGVKEIHYSVNGGPDQVATGATASVDVPLSGTGSASVKYYAVDVAGNVEAANTAALKYDNIAPTVTHTVNPQANASGWNNSDVTVHFDAKDTDPGSGVDASTVTPDQVVDTETSTSGRVVKGSAKDTAGNTGTDSVTVKLDKTKPAISGKVVGGTLGANGWYTSPVNVGFSCSDALSGVASCPDAGSMTLSDNGAGQSVTGTARDVADNTNSATVSGINIDGESPTITGVNVDGGFYQLGAAPAPTCSATDSFSGVQSCTVVVTGGSNGVGTFNWSATATDRAGNTSVKAGTYKVVYRFDGFLQPINDTAHQTGLTTSIFKAGSTIPVKLQLKKADGTVVQSATAPSWLAPVKGGAMSLPVDETVQTVSADSGSTFRYDATAQQYIYNWKSPSQGGNYYQIGVRLEDGQTYWVNIGLR